MYWSYCYNILHFTGSWCGQLNGGRFSYFQLIQRSAVCRRATLCWEKVRLGSPPSFYGREKLVVTRQSPRHENPCLPKPKHIPCIHLGSRMRPLLCCTLWIHVRIAGMHKIKKSAFYNAFLFLLEKKVILSPVSLSLKMNCKQAAVREVCLPCASVSSMSTAEYWMRFFLLWVLQ